MCRSSKQLWPLESADCRLRFHLTHENQAGFISFLTLPTAAFRVLYALVVWAHNRRRVVHFNLAEHPTAAWTAQQIVEAFPEECAPRFLLMDRDQIYGEEFRSRVKCRLFFLLNLCGIG